MNEINNLINKLSWNEDVDTQKNAIQNLIEIVREDDIKLLIQPGLDKSCWENAAQVLKGLGVPKINKEIPKLLEWLADMNWPGAIVVMEILAGVDKNILLPHISKAQEKANSDNDDMWLDALEQLLELIES